MRKLMAVVVAAGMLAGCTRGGSSTPLRAQSFYGGKQAGQPSGGGDAAAQARVEQPAAPTARSAGNAQTAAAAVPATHPATTGASRASGDFFVLGTVVAEANGQPVYADKILATIEPALAANARRLEPQQFRLVAKDLIGRAIMEQITDELEFAAAQRNTTPEDQQLAKAYTTAWRQREITRAGGSEAVARARSREEGMDFDERVDQQYRRHLIQFYYIKHVWPRVQMSANDMRRFYDQNVDALFSEKSAVRFRAIRVDLKQQGKEEAWKKATDAMNKARSGWAFEKIASNPQWNDHATWRENGGYWDMVETTNEAGQTVKEGVWTEKGTLAAEELEKAVFALNPGEVSDVIQTRDALYVARVEEKKTGRVLPFDDLKVQATIRDLMESEQRQSLRLKEQQKLHDKRYWSRDEKNVELTVDMAMQKYAGWARAESATSSTK